MKGFFVSLETLERWLAHMERDWHRIDAEWGPSIGGLDACLSEYPEISELRQIIKKINLTRPTVLAVMSGTRWVVTREEFEYYSCKDVIAVCSTQELALAFMRNTPDYGKYAIDYDCNEIPSYE